MKKTRRLFKLSLVALLIVATLAVCAIVSSAAGKFSDVKGDEWYANAVLKANELGIMNGTSDTIFAPLKNLSRAEYVAILFRLSGGEENMEFTFTDVPADAWYKKYVGWAESAGVITGYGNAETFGGGELITREQLMLMTSRYMKYEWIRFPNSDSAVEFADKAKISSWAADGVEVTRKAGLITGDANANFNPQNPATRAEIATIVVRYADKLSTALDPMHMKLQYITELVSTTGNNINLEFQSTYDIIVNYYNYTSIRQQLFSQMGLSLSDYELVMSDEDVEALRSPMQDTTEGSFFIKKISFAIRNKTTGETTQTVSHSFMVKKSTTEPPQSDPDSYPVDFSTDIYRQMLDVSLKSQGNIARLANFFDKAEKGENVTVGYIGGSITEGATAYAGNAWADVTHKWIKKHISDNAEFVNAGMSGTSSALGNLRAQRDLLDRGCDLVFVEYAVNDNQHDEYHRRSFEALLRTLLEHESKPAVVIVLCVTESASEDRYKPMETVASYYDLPIVDTRRAAHFIFQNTDMTYVDFAPDNIHPHNFGHKMMADMVIHLLKTVNETRKSVSSDKLTITPLDKAWFYDDTYANIIMTDAAQLLTEDSGWVISPEENGYCFTGSISTDSSDNILEFKFMGKSLVFAAKNTGNYIDVSVDGGAYVSYGCFDGIFGEAKSVCTFDSSSEHTVRIRLSPQSNGSKCTLLAIGICK